MAHRPTKIEHVFVTTMPAELQQGCLYISIEYKVATHLCLCGCGSKVVTPLSPVAWAITFDGSTVSLAPSIGSWNLACKSHYWIENSHVTWLGQWSASRIARGREEERQARERYYGGRADHGNECRAAGDKDDDDRR